MPDSWPLHVNLAAASQARDLLSAHCVARHPVTNTDSLHTALLLASELVTNAVRHGTGPVELGVTDNDEVFRVQVSDRSSELPLQMQPCLLDEGGRGLLLVQALSTRWGVTPRAGQGKAVWFELPPMPA